MYRNKKRPGFNDQPLDTPIIMVQQDSTPNLSSLLGAGASSLNSGDPRSIWFPTEVYPETITNIVQDIQAINYEDDIKEKEALLNNQTYIRHPIKLYVSSYGGSVYDGLGLIGIMRSSKTPVHTYSFGKVMSMGFLIAISGKKRFTFPHTTYMYHSVSSISWGKFAELEESVEEVARLQKIIDTLTSENTLITQETMDEVHRTKLDWYFDAAEALSSKCVDEIIEG